MECWIAQITYLLDGQMWPIDSREKKMPINLKAGNSSTSQRVKAGLYELRSLS